MFGKVFARGMVGAHSLGSPMTDARPPTIALLASRSLRTGPLSPLLRVVRAIEPWVRHVLHPNILAAGGAWRALRQYGVLDGYDRLEELPAGRDGGLVALAARLVDPAPERAVDWVIYLMDPADPTTLYPESQAVKRECVVNAKPFLATEAAALEWCTIHWLAADRDAPHPITRRFLRPRGRADAGFAAGLALIAHDAHKNDMVHFAADFAGLLSRFPGRLATGTTGALLNGAIPPRLSDVADALQREADAYNRLGFLPDGMARRLDEYQRLQCLTATLRTALEGLDAPQPWVSAMRSGPQGGDVQIAQAVLEGACHHVIFFEDPLVSREHEADILLLERAARIRTADTVCLHDPTTARSWASAWTSCLDHPDLVPVTLESEFHRRFGCDLIVAHDGPRETLRRYASGLIAPDGTAPVIVFAHEDIPRGGVAVLTPEEAAAALDRAAAADEESPG
jgi:methylglyoxal synthase